MNNQKTALIIGGSGGIGMAITGQLLKDGLAVCGTYCKNDDKVKNLRQELMGQPVFFYKLDLLDETAIQTVMREIVAEHNKIDVVVFAPTLSILHKPILDCAWEYFESNLQVQVRGMWCVVQHLKEQIKAKYKTKFIVILTEYCLGKPPGRLSPYVTAKYGLMGFAKTMAVELSQYNCTTNMISPGMVETELIKDAPPKLIEIISQQNPLKRIAYPNDVASVAAFLISDEADYLNGVNVPINGGNIMS